MAHEQRRLAVIVAIDVVGYSRLMGQNESGTHALLKTHLAERVEPSIHRHGGRVVKLTGDGALAEFDSAVNALSALIELQQAMAGANRDQPEPSRIVFRAGIHLGEVIVEADDLYGDDVNIAVRLQGESPPGGILISRAVREAVDGRIKAELHALGELSLKNIVRPIRAFRVEWKEADWPTATQAPLPKSVIPVPAFALSDKPSIAVLAFRNLSGDAEREYFADGMVDDIITILSRVPNFLVIARNSSYSYKGRSVDVRQIGSELGVRYVLDGSIRSAGNRLRINCVLIDATSGNHIWAERYDGAIEDVFDLQDSITSSIVATIYPQLMSSEITRAQAKPTSNLTAYDFYLRAIPGIVPVATESSISEALMLLDRAIAADPQFSSAYAYVARAHWGRLHQGWGSSREARAQGYEAAKRAVEIGKDDPVALALGGFGIASLGGKPEEGVEHIERALTLNPNFLMAWRFGGAAHSMIGKHEKSIQYFERAMQLSPRDDFAFETYIGFVTPCFFLGRHDQALHWAERALRDRPRSFLAIMWKIVALAMEGNRPDELADLLEQLKSLRPRFSIAGCMARFGPFQASDRKLFETALRRAGLPE
ncbi:adenylate/guanylate cyclase domain-containing protein [Reyranella sp.]|uniref:adenylate/guanylate cyclase domain-containing protein n=1 Tax=Reyranella sp. TaxID=1929291 RepID=UPI0011FEFEA1|nr:adenylate/guanylate cyclase domain-containing protein [Reyranella sp.]TAJ84509.1 MAG: adenylate/guanylate cyclase domain-containing protein [Reyranella sp.]